MADIKFGDFRLMLNELFKLKFKTNKRKMTLN